MGLFDIFKKKDAGFYLDRAHKELEREEWAYARDDAGEGLKFGDLAPEMDASLRETFMAASRGLCHLNIQEARLALESGDLGRVKECLDTARNHAPDDDINREVDGLAANLREAKKRSKEGETGAGRNGPLQDEPDETSEAFQVYLAGLAQDVAEVYSGLGKDFEEAYVSLNSGDATQALEVLSTLKPGKEEVAALLAFEKARAALAIGDPKQALYWLDVTGALRGAAPIYLSDHPSVAYLRFEALMALNRTNEAIGALKEGLDAQPDSLPLTLNLAGLLVSQRRFDEAEPVVEKAVAAARGDPQVHALKATLLVARGEKGNAIDVLEQAIKTCSCNPSALPHPALARPLAGLYLDEGREARRVETLLLQIFQAQKGQGQWQDHFLEARYHKWQGELEAAEKSAELALGTLPPSDPRRKEIEALVH